MSAGLVSAGLATALALAMGGCGGGAPAGGAPAGESGAAVLDIAVTDGFTFSPAQVTVAVGTTVRWTNKGAIPHTITSGASSRAADHPGALADHPLPSGAVFEVTLTTVGDWPYFCRYHEGMGMVGTLTVTAGPGAERPQPGNQGRWSAVLSGEATATSPAAQTEQLGR